MIEHPCEWCATPFSALAAYVKRGQGRYCCKSCKDLAHQARMSGVGHPNWGKRSGEQRICDVCQTPFYMYPSSMRAAKRTGQYCSNTCYGSAKRGSVRGPHHPDAITKMRDLALARPVRPRHEVTIYCVTCGNPRAVRPCEASTAKYCSRRCHSIANIQAAGRARPTGLESATYGALESMGFIFERQHRLGRYVVDAYLPTCHTVIEAFGDYWHCNPRIYPSGPENARQERARSYDPQKLAALAAAGYRVVILWEYDVKRCGATALLRAMLPPPRG
jgi:very-short-patch-repair endonuclease